MKMLVSNPKAQSFESVRGATRSKLLSLGLVALYLILFFWIYTRWGVIFHYMGLSYYPDYSLLLPVILVILIYTLLNRFQLKNIAVFIVETQFYVILVPALLIVSMQSEVSTDRIALVVSLFSAHLLLRSIAMLDLRVKIASPSPVLAKYSIYFVGSVSLLMVSYLVYHYHPYMRLVGLSEVYEQRFSTTLAVQIPLGGYIIGFLQTALSPILIARGLFDRKPSLVIAGVAIATLVYSILAAKIALAQTLMTIAFGVLVLGSRKIDINFILGGLAALLFFVFLILLTSNYEPDGLLFDLCSVIFMRSFAIQGAMAGVYLDFFESNPFTYYSHVNIIDNLVDYPYNAPLGQVVGEFMIGVASINANASFWVTDGIAAAGNFGIFIIATLVGIFFAAVKTLVPPEMTGIAATASIPFIMSLGNASFFTNLITGGGLILFVILRIITPASPDDPSRR